VRSTGSITSVEFEYFCVRRLGLDLEAARDTFTACMEVISICGTRASSRAQFTGLLPTRALLRVLTGEKRVSYSGMDADGYANLCDTDDGRQKQQGSKVQAEEDVPIEVRLELEWCVCNLDAASLRLCDVEIRQTAPPTDTDYVPWNAAGASPAPVPSPLWAAQHHALSKLHDQDFDYGGETAFFLRICLCEPDGRARRVAAAHRETAHRAAASPHIVQISPALWRGVRRDTGELYLRLPPDPAAGCADVSGGHGAVRASNVVPVVTTSRLREAAQSASLVKPPSSPAGCRAVVTQAESMPLPRCGQAALGVEQPGHAAAGWPSVRAAKLI